MADQSWKVFSGRSPAQSLNTHTDGSPACTPSIRTYSVVIPTKPAFLSLCSTGQCLADERTNRLTLAGPHTAGWRWCGNPSLLTCESSLFHPRPETILLHGMSLTLLWEKQWILSNFLAVICKLKWSFSYSSFLVAQFTTDRTHQRISILWL